MKNLLFIVFAGVFFISEMTAQGDLVLYRSAELKIEQLSENVFEHISYLQTEEYGKVACNGLVYAEGDEVLILDSPTNDNASEELRSWITGKLNKQIKAVVATHFHEDCLGGIGTFNKYGIRTLAEVQTIEIARGNNAELPEFGFSDSLKIEIGDKIIDLEFFGSGHTRDNIVAYIPSEKLLFGGCLLKANGSGKGNLQDADTLQWPETIKKIKMAYPEVLTVVPGHGKHGGPELLDYTIQLFE